ncbi:hypothetical protein GCM10022239_26510 [Leifsonia bigeumensis]|uniref:Uncharacterized protein n=1 Tax=Leifsonella bigeumensis TaxID=433643 RepID=A0ABP7FZ87_9MICO
MYLMLLVYAAALVLFTVGGLVIARAGVHSAHFTGSAVGVTACVVAAAALTVALTSSEILTQ